MPRKEEKILNEEIFHGSSFHISVRTEMHQGKVQPHSHQFYEFVYVDSGFSLHSFNGKTAVLTTGDLFAVTPGNVHSYFSANNTKIYNILFEMNEFSDMTEQIIALPGMEFFTDNKIFPMIKVDLAHRSALTALLDNIIDECRRKRDGWELAARCCLAQFFIMYSRCSKERREISQPGSGDYLNYIYKTINYIESNYSREISLAVLSKNVGLSSGYLVKQFKNNMDITPADYIRRFRTAKALELIRTTDKKMNDIAIECGFNDISVFSRIFKQIMGNPPTHYKQLI